MAERTDNLRKAQLVLAFTFPHSSPSSPLCPLDCAFREGDPEMTGFRQLKVVELDEGCDGFLHCGQLYQSHLPVFGEKLKCLDGQVDGIESLLQVILLNGGGYV